MAGDMANGHVAMAYDGRMDDTNIVVGYYTTQYDKAYYDD